MEAVQEKVTELLSGLGESPSDVAEKLKNLGIKGRRCDTEDCPIYHYLKEAVPGAGFAVAPEEVVISVQNADGKMMFLPVPLPDSVIGFIHSFDVGSYTSLTSDS